MNDEPTTTSGAIREVLVLPLRGPGKMKARPDGTDRPPGMVLAIWVLFVPLIVLYEAMAVPLVVGAVLATLALTLPGLVLAAVLPPVQRLVRRLGPAPVRDDR